MWRRRARFVTARAAVFLCLASESLSQQAPEVFGLEFQWPVLCRETPLDALDLLGKAARHVRFNLGSDSVPNREIHLSIGAAGNLLRMLVVSSAPMHRLPWESRKTAIVIFDSLGRNAGMRIDFVPPHFEVSDSTVFVLGESKITNLDTTDAENADARALATKLMGMLCPSQERPPPPQSPRPGTQSTRERRLYS